MLGESDVSIQEVVAALVMEPSEARRAPALVAQDTKILTSEVCSFLRAHFMESVVTVMSVDTQEGAAGGGVVRKHKSNERRKDNEFVSTVVTAPHAEPFHFCHFIELSAQLAIIYNSLLAGFSSLTRRYHRPCALAPKSVAWATADHVVPPEVLVT